MTKQTQMYVGVGVVAIAGYFLYKSMQTKKGFMNASGSMVVTKNGRIVGKSASSPKGGCKCSPNSNVAGQLGGKDVYECCGAGLYAYKAGVITPNCSDCNTGGGTTTTTVGQNFVGDMSFVGDNSRVFKGDM